MCIALLTIARLQGALVYGTASPSKHDELRNLGAIPFTYSNNDWIQQMKALGGADADFDALGYALLSRTSRTSNRSSYERIHSIVAQIDGRSGYGSGLSSADFIIRRLCNYRIQ